MIATIKPGVAIYPTGVYEKYNLYLIERCEYILKNYDFSRVRPFEQIVNINSMSPKELLEKNTSADIKNPFDVMDWEENLIEFYQRISLYVEYFKIEPLKKIDTFLRMEKLERLSNI